MLHKLSTVFVFILFLCKVIGQVYFGCEDDFCKKKENACPELNCIDNGIDNKLLRNVTTCGCCHVCIKKLKEGEPCKTEHFSLSEVEREGECGFGLVCNPIKKKCEPANTACINKRKMLPKVVLYKEKVFPEFDCNEFGYFKNFVCIPGVMCHCVDKNGNRIFGTDLESNKEAMKCDCSREINDFRSNKHVADEYLPRCLHNGNYDPIQCSDKLCFCTDQQRHSLIYDISINESLKDLPCYDNTLHENRLTKCQKERKKQMETFTKKTYKAVIGDLIRCDLDGSYFPVQCKKDSCYCVNRDGIQYPEYNVPRRNVTAMTCRCPRDKDILSGGTKNMKLFKEIKCDQYGNYEVGQVIESVFFKIDKNGT